MDEREGEADIEDDQQPAARQEQLISATGVIEAVDMESKKITIKHDPIPAVNWPAMTMRFTLVADTQKGMRPGFSRGATPAEADRLYQYFYGQCREKGIHTETGRFAADMKVALVNDGPVTFWLQV